ncbi:Initiation factor 2B-related [Macleaya cordata]|uniref:Initiation factor 2B-related n=1 Tax=Macleaya cordata TaxID=56857 RepID=A0A200Q4D1_MACCD|nr:Initiation factor 2B-related [Macleaya cordata]
MNGNGCTVYDSNGQIVYRIDNYNCLCSDEVYLMDIEGKVLVTIVRKKLRLFGRWEGYKSTTNSNLEKELIKPWFQVRKSCRFLKGNNSSPSCCGV